MKFSTYFAVVNKIIHYFMFRGDSLGLIETGPLVAFTDVVGNTGNRFESGVIDLIAVAPVLWVPLSIFAPR